MTAVMTSNLRCLREMTMPCLPVREKHNRSTAFGRSGGKGGDGGSKIFTISRVFNRRWNLSRNFAEKCYSNYNNSCFVSHKKFVTGGYVRLNLG